MTNPTNSPETTLAPIPLVDLKAAHAEVADEVTAGITSIIQRTAFVGGPDVAAFERAYAEYIGVEHVVGVASGTDALEIPLRALRVGPGDEVVLPANTFIATAEAVVRGDALCLSIAAASIVAKVARDRVMVDLSQHYPG